MSKIDWSELGGTILTIVFLAGIAGLIIWPLIHKPSTSSETGTDATMSSQVPLTNENEDYDDESSGTCIDVTSYDYNWNNDMLCTRNDGSEFYTDYSGARAFESN